MVEELKPNNECQEEFVNKNSFGILGDKSKLHTCTGYFNGYNVEVRYPEDMTFLYDNGCFGKGSLSRSKPNSINNKYPILRQRQLKIRKKWYDKFRKEDSNIKTLSSSKEYSKEVTKLNTEEKLSPQNELGLVVVVPDSESDGDDYFENLNPRCYTTKIKILEKLMLNLQEAYFIAHKFGCLQIINCDKKLNLEETWKLFNDTDILFLEKYVVYHYYRTKGYIVKSGIKFGGDYLLYKDKPTRCHAEYLILIQFDTQYKMDWITILNKMRVANTTAKETILAEVRKNDNIDEPMNLKNYSVQEVLIQRGIPGLTNNDNETK